MDRKKYIDINSIDKDAVITITIGSYDDFKKRREERRKEMYEKYRKKILLE